jgi:hypothetical protein
MQSEEGVQPEGQPERAESQAGGEVEAAVKSPSRAEVGNRVVGAAAHQANWG